MGCSDSLNQLLLLLGKSWKTFIRSRGWVSAQCLITLAIWGALIYFGTKMIDPSAGLGRPFDASYTASKSCYKYNCTSRDGVNCTEEITASLNGFCDMNNRNTECDMEDWSSKNDHLICVPAANQSDLDIRAFNESTVDIIYRSEPCPSPKHASNQFDNLNMDEPPPTQEKSPVTEGVACEAVSIFKHIAVQSGKLNGLEIKYLEPLRFRTEQSPSRWMSIHFGYSFAIMFFFVQIAREISHEASSNIKDYLLSMGMSRTLYFLHHFIFNFLKMWIVVIGCSAIFGYNYRSTGLGLYLFTVFSLALASWTSIAMVVGSTFKKPGTSTLAAMFLFLIMTIVPLIVKLKRTTWFSLLFSLIPHYAFLFVFDAKRESDLRGLNLWFSEVEHAIPQGYYLSMLLFDTIFYFFLAVFIDWMKNSFDNPLNLLRRNKSMIEEESRRLLENHEQNDGQSTADLVIESVHKMYSTGEHAVRGVDMILYKGQVTALLGHNGAGKSTIFSMISGMTVPTKGLIKVKGAESREERQKLIGYCPQYNAVFPKLTVDEHLDFFARLKGEESGQETGHRVLSALAMDNMGMARPHQLSGGMKRKLCIAIALAGNSPIILLDEPTAGLDPGARKDFERLLLEWKKDHTILLTTHYTDEAEMLTDRIFIMAKGRVFCSGSPQFLRKKFDSGFVLSFAVENDSDTERASNELLKAVQEYIPTASLCTRRGKQFEFKLITDDSSRFVEMFRKLESFGPYFGVQSYSLSLNKLEQVFLKVGEMTGTVDRSEEVEAALIELIQENDKRVKGSAKVIKQIGNILLKRLYFDLAHFPSLVFNLVYLFVLSYFTLSLMIMFIGKGKDGDSADLLTVPGCYRIGVDSSLHGKFTEIKRVSKTFIDCLIMENASSIAAWYNVHARSRPPILGGFSAERNEWTIHIHPRNERYLPTLETVAAMVNNPSLKRVKLEQKEKEMEEKLKAMMQKMKNMILEGLVGVVLSFVLPLMVVRPMGFLITERISNFGHQQRLTGISRSVSIFTSIFYDFLLYLLHFSVFITASFVAAPEFANSSIVELIYLPLIGFVSSELIIIFLYRYFNTRTKGETLISFLFLMTGIQSFGGKGMNPLMIVYPINAILTVKRSSATSQMLGCITGSICLLIHFVGLIAAFAVLELRLCARKNNKMTSRELSRTTTSDSLILRVDNLVKRFGSKNAPFYAVKGISFGVPSHECFGVLGVNGAGKTTTFEMITGNCLPDVGSASVGGVDCSTPASIGYCPQADALMEDLSGRQSLIILAALHGYENPRKVADIVITCVGMQQHANKKSKRYSGGQRRKISVAASLLAQNSLIILDEPTAGIDPIARRDIWSVICALRESTSTAIMLTSHSMDEVEALVSHLIIMKQGLIVVEGSPQMIKNQFGEHYNFNLVIENVSNVGQITSRVLSVFPTATLYDSASLRNIKYRIPRRKCDVFSSLFKRAQDIADELNAIDFFFTQATLEDAFMLAATDKVDTTSKPDVETAVAAVTSSVMSKVSKMSKVGKVQRSESTKESGAEVKTSGTERGTEGTGTFGTTEGGTTEGDDRVTTKTNEV